MNRSEIIPEERFWNDPGTISWFRDEPVPSYWLDFFRNIDRDQVNRVLDLGCGAGRVSEMLAGLGFDLSACDLHQRMTEVTFKRLEAGFPSIDWSQRVIRATMTMLPYREKTFDTIVSNGVYHNAQDTVELDVAVGESGRVLRSGGFICFNLFSSAFVASQLRQISEDIYLTAEGLHMTLLPKEQFLGMAEGYGLKVQGEVTEYLREVSTGKRSVMRGVLRKD